MRLLSLDCSTEIFSVAVVEFPDNERRAYCAEHSVDSGLGHARRVMPFISRLLVEAGWQLRELDAILVGAGPGSFTGLRIAYATAKGLSAGSGVPYLGVSSLQAFAFPYRSYHGVVVPVIDARKRRYYSLLLQEGGRLSDELDLGAEELAATVRAIASARGLDAVPALLTGPGAEQLYTRLAGASTVPGFQLAHDARRPPAMALAELGRDRVARGELDSPDSGPIYIRKSEAEIGILRGKGSGA